MSQTQKAPEGIEKKEEFDVKKAKKKFGLHVQLIEFQDEIGKADAQAKAYLEGPGGLARRAAK